MLQMSTKMVVEMIRFIVIFVCWFASAEPIETVVGSVIPVSGDDASAWVKLPFSFEFFCKPYTQCGVSTNGLITFSALSNSFKNARLPAGITSTNIGNFLAPFWDDLTAFAPSLWLYASDSRVIIQFTNMGVYKSALPIGTFQAHLFRNSSIIFYYVSLQGSSRAYGASASVGIEDSGGTRGFSILYHDARLRSGLCYHIRLSEPCSYDWSECAMDPVLVTVPGGPEAPADLAFDPANRTFTWARSPTAAYYEVYVARERDLTGPVANSTSLPAPSFASSAVTNGTYYWQVLFPPPQHPHTPPPPALSPPAPSPAPP